MHNAVVSKLIAASRGSPCDSMASCFRLIPYKILFSILTAGFCLKNLAFARKIMDLPDSGEGLQPPPQSPGSYAYDYVRDKTSIPFFVSFSVRNNFVSYRNVSLLSLPLL